MIPKNIFQTHKSHEYLKANKELFQAAFSWYKNKGYTYKFYTDKDCDVFMQQNYPDIYPLYAKLTLPVMKADLWRYCVIYKYGGIYADVDTILVSSPDIFIKNKDLIVAPENADHICQWTFAAPPGSPILKSIIDYVVSQISGNVYNGKHFVLNTTGPGAFTRGIQQYMGQHSQLVRHSNVYSPLGKSLTNNIYMFDYIEFHNNIVKHLFYGCKKDGWMKQRNSTIKNQKKDTFQLNVFS